MLFLEVGGSLFNLRCGLSKQQSCQLIFIALHSQTSIAHGHLRQGDVELPLLAGDAQVVDMIVIVCHDSVKLGQRDVILAHLVVELCQLAVQGVDLVVVVACLEHIQAVLIVLLAID